MYAYGLGTNVNENGGRDSIKEIKKDHKLTLIRSWLLFYCCCCVCKCVTLCNLKLGNWYAEADNSLNVGSESGVYGQDQMVWLRGFGKKGIRRETLNSKL